MTQIFSGVIPSKRIAAFAFIALGAGNAFAAPSSVVLASGLQGPSKVKATARGNYLVVESGNDVNKGRVSLVSSGGTRTTLIDGLPSAKTGENQFSGPTDAAVRGTTLYVLIGAGDVEARQTNGSILPNPKGPASQIFSSLLAVQYPGEIDDVASPISLTVADYPTLFDGNVVTKDVGAGQFAQVTLAADFRDIVSDPQIVYRGSNPYSFTFVGDNEIYVADASQNTLNVVNVETGRIRTLQHFASLANSSGVGPPRVDAVPNSVTPFGNGYLVSLLTGFPFTAKAARVDYFDPANGSTVPFITGLTTPIAVAVAPVGVYVLQFSSNLSAAQPPPGSLVLFDGTTTKTVMDGLITPTSVLYDAETGDVVVTELATGRLLRIFTGTL